MSRFTLAQIWLCVENRGTEQIVSRWSTENQRGNTISNAASFFLLLAFLFHPVVSLWTLCITHKSVNLQSPLIMLDFLALFHLLHCLTTMQFFASLLYHRYLEDQSNHLNYGLFLEKILIQLSSNILVMSAKQEVQEEDGALPISSCCGFDVLPVLY